MAAALRQTTGRGIPSRARMQTVKRKTALPGDPQTSGVGANSARTQKLPTVLENAEEGALKEVFAHPVRRSDATIGRNGRGAL